MSVTPLEVPRWSSSLDFLLDGLPQEVRDQLAAIGFDPAAMDADALESLLGTIRGQLPAEAITAIEQLIESMRSGGDDSSNDGGSNDDSEEKDDGPVRKNTPGGPVTIPGTG